MSRETLDLPLQSGAPKDSKIVCLVDTKRAGPRRWITAQGKDGSWLKPGTITEVTPIKPGHEWAYLP